MEEKEIKTHYHCESCSNIINEKGDYITIGELLELLQNGFSVEDLIRIDCELCGYRQELSEMKSISKYQDRWDIEQK